MPRLSPRPLLPAAVGSSKPRSSCMASSERDRWPLVRRRRDRCGWNGDGGRRKGSLSDCKEALADKEGRPPRAGRVDDERDREGVTGKDASKPSGSGRRSWPTAEGRRRRDGRPPCVRSGTGGRREACADGVLDMSRSPKFRSESRGRLGEDPLPRPRPRPCGKGMLEMANAGNVGPAPP